MRILLQRPAHTTTAFHPRRFGSTRFRSFAFACFSSTTTAMSIPRVIDSHLHVWANAKETPKFPYGGPTPPANHLQNTASIDDLIHQMDQNGISGALIVQPIHHGFDHSYVLAAMERYPDRCKGMLLHEPGTTVTRLEQLVLSGNFQGVRFNPYLWGETAATSNDLTPTTTTTNTTWNSMCTDMDVYKRCGDLQLPVGIMCFQGLDLHMQDILQFLFISPDTTLILDHFGFASTDANFRTLLSLAEHPSVYVKVSALFRLGDESPYERIRRERFLPLLQAFSSERLLFGSDFPFCLEQPEGYNAHSLVAQWCENDKDRDNILFGTSERLFGPWRYSGGIQT